MEDKLGNAVREVIEGVQQIVENSIVLSGDLSNSTAKKGVLDGSKKILQNLVNCLQLTDIYQCANLITKSNELSVKLDELRIQATSTRSADGFQEVCKQIINLSVHLVTFANERSQLINPHRAYYEMVSVPFYRYHACIN